MTDDNSLVRIGPDATQLKALAHPLRLKILGVLRMEGPQTATALAERFDLNSGATSYHLRQLALHGFIQDAKGVGNKRDRWWQAAHQSTRYESDASPASAEGQAGDAYLQSVMTAHVSQMQRAQMARSAEPEAWRQASTASDMTFWLTAEQARELTERLVAILGEIKAETPPMDHPGPDGTRRFTVMIHGFPYVPAGKDPAE